MEDKGSSYQPQQQDAISSSEPHLTQHRDPTQDNIVVITQQSEALILGPEPCPVSCPSCHAPITTTVKIASTTKTHLWAACLCFLGGLLCVWIPYCTKCCRDRQHYCPNCNAYLGRYEK